MKKHLLKALAFTLFCLSANVNAQNELWYFGGWPTSGAGIYFNGGSLNARNNETAWNFYESTTVVSDGSGGVLYYSDGLNVYDKTHSIMTGGNGLLGSNEPGLLRGSSPQGAVSVNAPGNPNRYYLFTTGDCKQSLINANNGFRYHVIDMNVGTNGTVTSKNNVLLSGSNAATVSSEHCTAIAGSCDTTWILTHGANGGNTFYAFMLTPSGINTTPITSNVGPTFTTGNDGDMRGTFAFSPHGDRLAMACGKGLYLFDFDIKTGIVSNSQTIANSSSFYGTEFSPDGSKLYYTQLDRGDVNQYDLCTGTITLINSASFWGGELVLAPNGKIYTTYNGSQNFAGTDLSEIANPNAAGAACNFTAQGYNTGQGLGFGLPQMYFDPAFINNGNVQIDVTKSFADTICTSTSLPCLSLAATPNVAGSWRSVPSGYVDVHGTFNPAFNSGQDTTVVKVYFGMAGSCVQEDSVKVVVVQCCLPIGTNAPSAPICPDDILNLNTLITNGTGTWTIGTTPPPAPGKANATIVGSNFTTKLNTNSGDYTVIFTLNNAGAGCPDTTQEHVSVKNAPNNAPVKSFSFCAGDSVQISGAVGAYDYLWTPGGQINSSKYVKAAGTHYLTTIGTNNCIAKDTIAVSQLSLPTTAPIDTSVCVGGAVNISAPSSNNNYYLWDDATTGATDNISTTGKHWVIIEANSGCRDTVFVQVNAGAPLNVSLNNPPNSCAGGSTTLTATVTGIKTSPLVYEWDNVVGASSKVYNVGGTYTVEVTDARNCKGTDNATFSISPSPSVSLPADTYKCFAEGEKLTVSIPDTFTTIKWNGVLSADSFYVASSAGTVTVIVSNIGGCLDTANIVLTEKCSELKWDFPNVFTPNGDGKNDNFYPLFVTNETINKLKAVHFEVYDRWGILMYKNNNLVIPEWDGKFNGNLVSTGVYYWIVKWTDTANTQGEKTGWTEIIYEK